jgi:hypothetical protein
MTDQYKQPKRLGDGIQLDDGLVVSAIRGLAHRSGCTYEEAKAACLNYREKWPSAPEHSTPLLVEAAEPEPVLKMSGHQPAEDIAPTEGETHQWWEVPGSLNEDK